MILWTQPTFFNSIILGIYIAFERYIAQKKTLDSIDDAAMEVKLAAVLGRMKKNRPYSRACTQLVDKKMILSLASKALSPCNSI
jgi:hypothetical protein